MKHVVLNAYLAMLVVAIMVSTLNMMQIRKTPKSVILSALVIFIGMVGEGLGILLPRLGESVGLNLDSAGWMHSVDTMVYSGIGAFLLACRRYPCAGKLRPRWVDSASIAISLTAIVVCLGAP